MDYNVTSTVLLTLHLLKFKHELIDVLKKGIVVYTDVDKMYVCTLPIRCDYFSPTLSYKHADSCKKIVTHLFTRIYKPIE